MSRQVYDLETLLAAQVEEHQKLLVHLENHQRAMKAMDLKAIDALTHLQEAARLRIATLETRRKQVIALIARQHRMTQAPTLAVVANLYPPAAPKLMHLRDQLRDVAAQVQARSTITAKLAGAVLGHLNTVVRLLAGAVEKAGLYTKQGVPQVSARIGAMEAIG